MMCMRNKQKYNPVSSIPDSPKSTFSKCLLPEIAFFQNKNQCNRTRKCNENRLIQTAFRYVRYRRTAAAYTKNGQQILYFVSGIAAAFGNHISKYRICDTPDDAKRFNLRKQKITDMVYRHSDHADDFERGCAYTAHCSIVATFCLYHSFSPPAPSAQCRVHLAALSYVYFTTEPILPSRGRKKTCNLPTAVGISAVPGRRFLIRAEKATRKCVPLFLERRTIYFARISAMAMRVKMTHASERLMPSFGR